MIILTTLEEFVRGGIIASSVCRSEKEKQKFQAEVYELLAQVENAQKEKMTAMKTVEKLETTVYELNIRIEELNRTIVEVTAQRRVFFA